MAARIRHIALCVKDIDATADFYEKAFGMKRTKKHEGKTAWTVYMSDGEVNLALLQYKSEVGSGVPQGLDRHPPFRLPVRRPAGAAEADREGRRQVLLRSRRARGRRLRAQVQGPERHRLRHQLEGLAAHQGQGEERQGRPRRPATKRAAAARKKVSKKTAKPGQDGAEEEITRRRTSLSGEEGHEPARAFACACGAVGHRRAGAELSDPRGHGDRAVRRRRTGRHHRPHRRRYLLAPSRPAVRGRERRRRRRHHRHDAAPRAPRPTATRSISGHLGTNALRRRVLSQPRLRPGEGFRADRADRRAAGAARPCARISRRTTSRSSSPTPRRTRASSTWRMPASARCPISAACCSTAAIGIKPTLVPFTGTAPAMNAILAGQVDYDCDPVLGPAAACARRHRQGARHRRQEAEPAAAGRADLRRAGHAGVRHARRSMRCSRPRARRRRSSTSSPRRSSKGLDEPAVRKRLESLGADIAEPDRRGPKALAELVHSEIARLTPILKAAAAK